MPEIFSILHSVGLRDWSPSRFVNKPLYEWPEQLRLYSNGNNSAFLRISKGKIVDRGSAQESYESKKPIAALWPEVAKHISLGLSVLYFGAVDNQITVKPVSSAPMTPPSSGAVQSAAAYHLVGEGEGSRLECITMVHPDLYSNFLHCAQKRVPVEIFDELTAYLSLIEKGDTLKPSGYQFVIVISEHTAYLILYCGRQLLSVSESIFRQGDVFDPPQYEALATDAVAGLGRALNSVSAAQVEQVVVWDVTARIAEEDWRIQLEGQFKQAFPQSALVVKTPAELIPQDIPAAELAEMFQLSSFPLPLFSFLNGK